METTDILLYVLYLKQFQCKAEFFQKLQYWIYKIFSKDFSCLFGESICDLSQTHRSNYTVKITNYTVGIYSYLKDIWHFYAFLIWYCKYLDDHSETFFVLLLIKLFAIEPRCKLESSAYDTKKALKSTARSSLTYNINSMGAKIEPCGTLIPLIM